MEQRLERSDIRLLLACAAVTVLSLLLGTHFFYEAFPEATIDFRLTRDEAREKGASFLEHRGFDIGPFRHAAVFRFDGKAKTFLERELGLEGASDALGDPIRLWRWSNRWFRELHKEEFRVQHTTTGELVGYLHLLEEEATGARLGQDEARRLARQFLSQSIGIDLATLEFVEAETSERPNRVDHAFTWELADFRISDATYRYHVGIQGDLVGEYREYLKVPESWQRQYDELRSRNDTTGMVAGLFIFLTWLVMLVSLVPRIRQQDVRWRAVLLFAGITFVLTLLAQLNALPVTVFGFDTTDSYGSFVTESVLLALAVALVAALGIGFVVAAGEPEYRRWYGGQISLSEQFLLDGIRTKRFLIGTVIGVTMTAMFVAYQIVFYLVAEHFGAWGPANIPYTEMVNTYIPWVVVLLIGFLPAVSEEFTSRLFSIPFLHRVLKRRWMAILLSALVWGFAHANYPQQPFWIRGVEVGLAGIAVGYVFVRWGLVPVLVWHYTIDALYTALILLRSSSLYYVLSSGLSVGLMLLPLGVAVAFYLRHRFFIDPVSLLNREDSTPSLPTRAPGPAELSPEAQILSAQATPTYHSLSWTRLGVGALAVIAAVGVFVFDAPDVTPQVGYALHAEEALQTARQALAKEGVTVDDYRHVVTQSAPWDGLAVDYRDERGGPEVAVAPYHQDLAPALWRVRFFRPLEKEEWIVFLRPGDGEVYEIRHQLPEEAAGADLEEDEAQAVAEDHLRRHGLDPEAFTLKESSTEALPERRDHWFEWEARQGDARNLDEAMFRCRVHVAGDRPAGLRRYIKLPEDWRRQRQEDTLWRTVLQWLPIAAGLGIALHLLWLLVASIRAGSLTWRLPLWIGGGGAILFALGAINALPAFYDGYPTEIPLGLYVTGRIIGVVLVTLIMVLMIAGSIGLGATLFPTALDSLSLRGLRPRLRDAVLLSCLAVVGGLATDRIGEFLALAWPEGASAPRPAIADLDSYWPSLSVLLAAVQAAIFMPVMAAIAVFYAIRVLRRPSYVVLAMLALGAAGAGAEARTAAEFFYELATFVVSTGITVAAVYWFYRDNVAAYALTGFLTTAVDGGLRLLEQPAYEAHGWLPLGLGAAVAVALLGLWLGARDDGDD